jgi:GH43 family beta-xylosidase
MFRFFRSQKVTFNNKLFIVVRKIRADHNPIIETWKDHLGVETVLKRDGYYYFCEEIPNIDFEELT